MPGQGFEPRTVSFIVTYSLDSETAMFDQQLRSTKFKVLYRFNVGYGPSITDCKSHIVLS